MVRRSCRRRILARLIGNDRRQHAVPEFDAATAIPVIGGPPQAAAPLFQGWSARATAGLNAKLVNGALLGVGAEYGGLGSSTQTWTVTGKARVPF